MTEQEQRQLGNTLWAIADQLRGAMNADDFRDYMLSFLFLRKIGVWSRVLCVPVQGARPTLFSLRNPASVTS